MYGIIKSPIAMIEIDPNYDMYRGGRAFRFIEEAGENWVWENIEDPAEDQYWDATDRKWIGYACLDVPHTIHRCIDIENLDDIFDGPVWAFQDVNVFICPDCGKNLIGEEQL
jgi:hypothetical protein